MKIYVTRHGQVRPAAFQVSADALEDAFFNGDPNFPKGEPSISQLGRGQALLLADRLVRQGFHGPIYSSPYIRTMQTAELIAGRTGSAIYPMGFLREFMFSAEAGERLHGSDIDTLRGLFPHVAPDAVLPMPWWTKEKDEIAPMRARVAADLRAFLATQPEDAEFLLLGHGASVMGVVQALQLPIPEGARGYNCALTTLDTRTGTCEVFDMSHLPPALQSNNCHNDHYGIPAAVLQETALRVGHLSDTRPAAFPFLREVLCTLRPRVILHTGNLVCADDPDAVPRGLSYLASAFRECGAETLHIVPGERDDPAQLRQFFPDAVLARSGDRLTLGGTDFELSRGPARLTAPAHYYCCSDACPAPQRGTVCPGSEGVQLIVPLLRRVWTIPIPTF